ncbi:methyltransferase like 4 isoform X2 [Oratosquilla oratoria]|uniref:methyltransferase like 4 isoform X2 n=1 Tax=Oratosquilla oratoria TaxID=337810 RepID=UPI003F76D2D9
MTVVHRGRELIILDHEDWLNTQLSKVFQSSNILSHHIYGSDGGETPWKEMLSTYFAVYTPFLMDQQAEKAAQNLEAEHGLGALQEIQQPKRKKQKTAQNMDGNEFEEEDLLICRTLEMLKKIPEFQSHFSLKVTPDHYRLNNRTLRESRHRFLDESRNEVPLNTCGFSKKPHINEIDAEKYLIPADCQYICDKVENLREHIHETFDLIVMDPPWYNGYVKRRNKSQGKHAGESGLLVVWCTNNHKMIHQFRECLQHWGLDLVATWYWLKVTKAGDPVTKVQGNHGKRPYERILFARRKHGVNCRRKVKNNVGKIHQNSESSVHRSEDCNQVCVEHMNFSSHDNQVPTQVDCASDYKEILEHSKIDSKVQEESLCSKKGTYSNVCCGEVENASDQVIPDELVLVSVPSGIHSHKPPLYECIKPYLSNEPRCLELFARYLQPGWTSVGLEVLRLQHLSFII